MNQLADPVVESWLHEYLRLNITGPDYFRLRDQTRLEYILMREKEILIPN